MSTTTEGNFVISGIDIRSAGRNGKGVFATRAIARGTLLIDEAPLIVSPLEDKSIGWYSNLVNKFQSLPDDRKTQYLSLAADQHILYAVNAIFRSASLRIDEKSAAICAIFSVNNCRMDNETCGVFPTYSRINHSCAPNTTWGYHESSGHIRVFAHKDIAAEEEITTSYVEELCASRQDRHKHIHFTCECSVCTLPEDELRTSDAQRERTRGLETGVEVFISREHRDIYTDIMGNVAPFPEEDLINAIKPSSLAEAVELVKEEIKLLGREHLTGQPLHINIKNLFWGARKDLSTSTLQYDGALFDYCRLHQDCYNVVSEWGRSDKFAEMGNVKSG
ncbi:hypothetical protein F5Y18DRAFT_424369 [Xylariaceae sp. FL1019]|nr:hypothetical protein F5Y18DRAFT_424369 [Xylariaceae sp. FL1019]